MNRRKTRSTVVGLIAIAVSVVVFLVPFAFIVLQAVKTPKEAGLRSLSWPTTWQAWDNLQEVFTRADGQMTRAFVNSFVLTAVSVPLMVLFAAMVGYLQQRRPGPLARVMNFFVLAGLIVPPAVVPTIWVLQRLHLFKTLPGLILIEATYGLSFCILLFRAFVGTIPKELDEAAMIDGAGPVRLFFRVILPLLRPVIATVVVVQSVAVFNDFANPLYFFPGSGNETVQATLFAFQNMTLNEYNLLFMDILLITIPPLLLFVFFNRQVVEGMTSGSLK
ncbi:MAG: carbohydrate ABC transporter permease [Propionibacteriaceae bacterium]|nr:carbohydrate ABC transporter permease [Propionibacteriaceae bacterium]